MPTVIKGQPTSKEVIEYLKDYGEPVILQFSCGKDSIATWLALREAGIEVVPVYMWIVPNLKFIDEELKYFEEFFGTKIHRYPHPSFYEFLCNCVEVAPHQGHIIDMTGFEIFSYEEMEAYIRQDLDLLHSYFADGVRAADSIVRRTAFVKYGVIKDDRGKVSPIADWLKKEVYEIIERYGVQLPVDYELFGRSFDGLDSRFIRPLKEAFPEDYEVLRTWFPMIEADKFLEFNNAKAKK